MTASRRRLPVQYCPHCGEQDLRPVEGEGPAAGEAWRCADCRTDFVVSPAVARPAAVPHRPTTAAARGSA